MGRSRTRPPCLPPLSLAPAALSPARLSASHHTISFDSCPNVSHLATSGPVPSARRHGRQGRWGCGGERGFALVMPCLALPQMGCRALILYSLLTDSPSTYAHRFEYSDDAVPESKSFQADSQTKAYSIGDGAIGKAWASSQPEWSREVRTALAPPAPFPPSHLFLCSSLCVVSRLRAHHLCPSVIRCGASPSLTTFTLSASRDHLPLTQSPPHVPTPQPFGVL